MDSAAPTSFLLLLLLLSAAAVFAMVAASDSKITLPSGHKYVTHLHLFFHEKASGTPNATSWFAVDNNHSFSSIKVYDNALRLTAALDSPVIGRAQGFGLYNDLGLSDAPTGGLTLMNMVFTAGEHNGSTLALMGVHRPRTQGVSERTIIGGSGKFHMARGAAYTWWVSPVGSETNVVEGEIYLTEAGSGATCQL